MEAALKHDLANVRELKLNQTAAEREPLCQLAVQVVAVIFADNAASYYRHSQRHSPTCMFMNDIFDAIYLNGSVTFDFGWIVLYFCYVTVTRHLNV